VPFVVPASVSAPDVLVAIQQIDVRALVVAPAFEEVVGQALDELDHAACRVGRVNLIELQDGRLRGGWAASMDEAVARLDAQAVPS
jgi:shikimate 5-dehydrogenase